MRDASFSCFSTLYDVCNQRVCGVFLVWQVRVSLCHSGTTRLFAAFRRIAHRISTHIVGIVLPLRTIILNEVQSDGHPPSGETYCGRTSRLPAIGNSEGRRSRSQVKTYSKQLRPSVLLQDHVRNRNRMTAVKSLWTIIQAHLCKGKGIRRSLLSHNWAYRAGC